jgi:hypothetical protein
MMGDSECGIARRRDLCDSFARGLSIQEKTAGWGSGQRSPKNKQKKAKGIVLVRRSNGRGESLDKNKNEPGDEEKQKPSECVEGQPLQTRLGFIILLIRARLARPSAAVSISSLSYAGSVAQPVMVAKDVSTF